MNKKVLISEEDIKTLCPPLGMFEAIDIITSGGMKRYDQRTVYILTRERDKMGKKLLDWFDKQIDSQKTVDEAIDIVSKKLEEMYPDEKSTD